MAREGFAIAVVPNEEGCRSGSMASGGFVIAAVLKEEWLPQWQYGKWRVRYSRGIERGRFAAAAIWQGKGSL